MAPPCRKCNFNSDLQKEFPLVKSTSNLQLALFIVKYVNVKSIYCTTVAV